MKKFLVVLLALVLVFTFVSCSGDNASDDSQKSAEKESSKKTAQKDDDASKGSDKPTYNWTVSSGLPVDSSWDQGLKKFKELLQEKSDGRIDITIYSGGTLGGAKEALEGVQMGSIDMIVESSASLSNFTDAMAVYDLPYLFPDAATAREVLSGDTAQAQLDALEEAGLKGINYWENGVLAIGLKEEVRTPADLAGLRIRAIDSPLQADTFSCFDAYGVVLAWGDIYTSLQNGVIDGVDSTTVPNMHSMNFFEVAPYICKTNHGYSPAPLMMGSKLWNSLSEEDQAIVMEAAEEARVYHYQVCDDILSTCEADMEEKGATIIEVDTKEWSSMVQPIYDEYVGEDGIDPELVEKFQKEVAAITE